MNGLCALLILAIAISHAATTPVFQTVSPKADSHHVHESERSADGGFLEDDKETDYSIYSSLSGDFRRKVSSVMSDKAIYSKQVKDIINGTESETSRRFHQKVKDIGSEKSNRFTIKDDLIVTDSVANPSQNFPFHFDIMKRNNDDSLSARLQEEISHLTSLKNNTENQGHTEVTTTGHQNASNSKVGNTDNRMQGSNLELRLNSIGISGKQIREVSTLADVFVVTEDSEAIERSWETRKDGMIGGDGIVGNNSVAERARTVEIDGISFENGVTEDDAITKTHAMETDAMEVATYETDGTETSTMEAGPMDNGEKKSTANYASRTKAGAAVVGKYEAAANEIGPTEAVDTKHGVAGGGSSEKFAIETVATKARATVVGATNASATGTVAAESSSNEAGATDVNVTEAGATEAGVSEPGTTEVGTTDAGAIEAGAIVAGATDASAIETGATEADATEVGATEVAATEVGATEVGAIEVGATEVGATEVGATEVGATEVGATEVGATEVGATEVGATEVSATEAGTIETGTTESDTTETGTTEASTTESAATESDTTKAAGTEAATAEDVETDAGAMEAVSTEAVVTEVGDTEIGATEFGAENEAGIIQVTGLSDDSAMNDEFRIKEISGVTEVEGVNIESGVTGRKGLTKISDTVGEGIIEIGVTEGSKLAVRFGGTEGFRVTGDANSPDGVGVTERINVTHGEGMAELRAFNKSDQFGKNNNNYMTKEHSERTKLSKEIQPSVISVAEGADFTEGGQKTKGATNDVATIDAIEDISRKYKSSKKLGFAEGKRIRDEKITSEKIFAFKGKQSEGVKLPLKNVKYTKYTGAGVKRGRGVSFEGTGRSRSPQEEVASITYSNISGETISKLNKLVDNAEDHKEANFNGSARGKNGHTENKLSVKGNVNIEEVTEGTKDQTYKGWFMLDKGSTTYELSGVNNNFGGGTIYDAKNIRHYKDHSQFINAYNLGGNNADMSYFVEKNIGGYLVNEDISDSIHSSGLLLEPSGYGYGDELYPQGTGYGVSAEGATSGYHGQEGSVYAGVDSQGIIDQSPLNQRNNVGIYYQKINYSPKYHFRYEVNDELSRDIKSHEEERNGDLTRGSYSLREPDGTIRTVDYHVDGLGGFHAVVKKDGYAVHIPPRRVFRRTY